MSQGEHFRCTLASFIPVGTFSQAQDLTDRSSYGKFMVSEVLLQAVINMSLLPSLRRMRECVSDERAHWRRGAAQVLP